jgi:phage protein D
MIVSTPKFVLTYKGVDITTNISPMTLSVAYIDRLSAAAGEIEVELEDAQKLWQGPWYPQQGDVVNLQMGYEEGELLPCGDFQVDELELEGPPDVFRIRCLAAWITPAMRTLKSAAYENQSLSAIAQGIAESYSFTFLGTSNTPDVVFSRVTQREETDLGFLKRQAVAHGYDFTVRGNQLVFYAVAALEGSAPVISLGRSNILSFNFVDKTHEVYQAAEVSYQQLATKELVSQALVATPAPASGDSLKRRVRCEDGQQAALKAQSALHAANMKQRTMRLVTQGMPILAAGSVITIGGFGVKDGNYLIETARHSLNRSTGYTTAIEARQL